MDKTIWQLYPDYASSDLWRKKKAEYRASTRPQKCFCGFERVSIHHMTYDHKPGEEPVSDLLAVCQVHHQEIHDLQLTLGVSIREATLGVAAANYRRGIYGAGALRIAKTIPELAKHVPAPIYPRTEIAFLATCLAETTRGSVVIAQATDDHFTSSACRNACAVFAGISLEVEDYKESLHGVHPDVIPAIDYAEHVASQLPPSAEMVDFSFCDLEKLRLSREIHAARKNDPNLVQMLEIELQNVKQRMDEIASAMDGNQ